jgi:hypothetical protein
MPFKFDANGAIVTQEVNGQNMPVFIHPDGKEAPFDADSTLASIRARAEQSQRVEAENKDLKEKVKAFDGLDAEEARKAIATVKNLDDKKLVDAGEVERVKAETIKAVEEQYKPIKDKAAELESQLNRHLIGGAFARSKFIAEKFAAEGPAGVEIAEALFGSRLKVEGGKVVGYDANGAKLYSRSRPGELADPDEAIELLVDSYPHKASILKGSGSSGSGSSGSSNGGGGKKTIPRAQFDQLDPAGRMAHVKAGGVVTD